MIFTRRLMLGASAAALLIASRACGLEINVYDFDQPSESLKDALRQVTRTGGIDLYVGSDDVAGRTAPALHGSYSTKQALDILLAGTGLKAEISGQRAFVRPFDASPQVANMSADIVVTGTRIRGAAVASPMVTLTQRDILESGKATLGDAVRALPQNFGGGQNPGIAGDGSQANNTNFNSSSAINLRGLGPDATLTLLNGHRLAYNSYLQGIDLDSIPLAALDRIEIVPDGASALYGSDAVGGVANIILKRDYQGATISARAGTTTAGGGSQQQYSLVGGRKWDGGGFMVAADYSHDDAVRAGDRSIADGLAPDQTLYPVIRHTSLILSGHQSVGPATLELDSFVNRRTSVLDNAYSAPESYRIDGYSLHPREIAFEISPKISAPLGGSWRGYVSGTYGYDHSRSHLSAYLGSEPYLDQLTVLDNSLHSVEAGLDGPIIALGGKTIRAAIGGGYRSNRYRQDVDAVGSPADHLSARETVKYLFAEIAVPIVAPADHVRGIEDLSISGSARYETYQHSRGVTTPKLGLIYTPVPGVTLKGSWGKSFKAPTLYEKYSAPQATSFPTYYFGSGYPDGSTTLVLTGGNPDLKPERATSWVATLEIAPSVVPALKLGASYYHTRYSQRVVIPFDALVGSFANPAYQYLIHYAPSAAEVAAITAGIPGGVVSGTGEPYDPASVDAIVDDRQHNAEQQVIEGVDGRASYRFALGDGRAITASGSATYLRIRQELGPGQPSSAVSGRIFRVPMWKAQAGLSYDSTRFVVSADATYVGAVLDDRLSPFARVGSRTTVDLTGIYHFTSSHSVLNRIDLTLTIQNLFNAMPSKIRSLNPNDIPYDSSNYSAFGRFVGLTASKSF